MSTYLLALVIAVVTTVALHRDIARAVERRRLANLSPLTAAFRRMGEALATTGIAASKATEAMAALRRVVEESGQAMAGNTDAIRRPVPRYQPRHRA